MEFVAAGGSEAIITSIENMKSALERRDGTRIFAG